MLAVVSLLFSQMAMAEKVTVDQVESLDAQIPLSSLVGRKGQATHYDDVGEEIYAPRQCEVSLEVVEDAYVLSLGPGVGDLLQMDFEFNNDGDFSFESKDGVETYQFRVPHGAHPKYCGSKGRDVKFRNRIRELTVSEGQVSVRRAIECKNWFTYTKLGTSTTCRFEAQDESKTLSEVSDEAPRAIQQEAR